MAVIKDIITVGGLQIITVDTNPSSGLGTPAPIGSLALTEDGSGTYTKTGALDTDWTL